MISSTGNFTPPERQIRRDLTASYDRLGEVLAAQGKFQEALDAQQQALAIAKRLADQDNAGAERQRDLIISFFNVGRSMAMIGGSGNFKEAQRSFQEALKLANLYPGSDRQDLKDALTQALTLARHSSPQARDTARGPGTLRAAGGHRAPQP